MRHKVDNRPLLVLHSAAAVRETLEGWAHRGGRVEHVGDWAELRLRIRAAKAVPVAMVDPCFGSDDAAPADALRQLLTDFRYVPVVAVMATAGAHRELLTLARWGVSEVIALDREVLGVAIPERLRSLEGWGLRTLLVRNFPPGLPGPAASVLTIAAETVSEGGSSEDLARTLRVSRRTLSRWCAKAGLPPPRRVLAWLRLLLAAELLDDWRRKVAPVAFVVGYSSDNALRTAFDAFMQQSPKQLRRVGALQAVSDAFWKEVRSRKHSGRAPAS